MTPEELPVPLEGGRALVAQVWSGALERGRSVVCLGALGAEQRYLRHFAPWLASRGWNTLTFDYRGVGLSRAAGDRATNLDAWGEDVAAVLAAAHHRFPGTRVVALGHSLGGMLLGHSGAGDRVAGAVAIASTLGAPRLYGIGIDRARLELVYALFPPLARLRGHLPRFALGARVPRDVILQWARWGRGGRYLRWDGRESRDEFLRCEGPLVGIALEDDGYAPLPAVDAFLSAFPRARTRREVIGPRPGERIGHFGLFRKDAPEWAREAILRELESVAGM